MNKYSNDYLKNQIEMASKEQLLILFYDGAIRFTHQARIAIENKDIEGRNYAVNKASAIVTELSASLDHDVSSSLAEELDALYGYMLRVYGKTCITNDAEELLAVQNILSDLRETWTKAIKLAQQEDNGYQPSPPAHHQPLSVAM